MDECEISKATQGRKCKNLLNRNMRELEIDKVRSNCKVLYEPKKCATSTAYNYL